MFVKLQPKSTLIHYRWSNFSVVCLHDVPLIVFEHVAPRVSRHATVLDSFQEFVMVLINLQLKVPLQNLAYC